VFRDSAFCAFGYVFQSDRNLKLKQKVSYTQIHRDIRLYFRLEKMGQSRVSRFRRSTSDLPLGSDGRDRELVLLNGNQQLTATRINSNYLAAPARSTRISSCPVVAENDAHGSVAKRRGPFGMQIPARNHTPQGLEPAATSASSC
jgi:hypothetical protein